MPHLRHYRRFALAPALAAVMIVPGMIVTGCGSGGKPSAHKGAGSPVAQITANWEAFFSGRTPAAKKVSLVQDGSAFATVINAQAGSGMAKSVAAKVSKVTVAASGKAATVRYSITMGGKAALSNQTGQAVKQAGTWKVGTASFCALLALEGTKPPACTTK